MVFGEILLLITMLPGVLVSDALTTAVFFTPPAAVTLPIGIVLVEVAAELETTSINTSQVKPGINCAPDNTTLDEPATAVTTGAPGQVVDAFGGVATAISPNGNGSLKLTLFSEVLPTLPKRIRNCVLPPGLTLLGENDLAAVSAGLNDKLPVTVFG